ncbi:hypothetical protein MLD38_029490 [Melastoma candidum]|uniref:Uncharacterized protein n=1 Tax=Melastoma candidum TaxID=119954 RepID=A0ACB9N611_9MYRT|nr:hypothetical protein MLD38_029490 [Melastoma candidum]
MEMSPKWSIIVVSICFIIIACNTTVNSFDTDLKERTCNGDTYPRGNGGGELQFECTVNRLMRYLLNFTPRNDSRWYYTVDSCYDSAESTAYGYGECTPTLSQQDCFNCMMHAHDDLFKVCTHSVGAQVRLGDCKMRYEKYDFAH